MKIPFADLSLQHGPLSCEFQDAFMRVLKRGDFILGEDVSRFERDFGRFCRAKYAVGVSSGTDALFLALMALGIGPGDEVIVPTYTYIASALAVSYTQAHPVFVDIDERTYNIDPGLIERAITKRTKAIMPVHLYGQPARMESILKIAAARNLRIIEDAAQAHGAAITLSGNTRYTGTMGDIGCFSFYPSKNLGGLGDGGMCVTDDEKLYKKLLKLRDYGRVSKYEHAFIGYNARLDTIQAALLRIKLRYLRGWNISRQRVAAEYNRLFARVPGITVPFKDTGVNHVYHVYAIRVPHRNDVIKELTMKGISAIIHYPIPVHLQEAYKGLGYKKGDFPAAERVCSEILSLPMYPHMDKKQIQYVVDAVVRAVKR
jgi:dTDP-4-amino-4,6-dideoxygalactose transaminase